MADTLICSTPLAERLVCDVDDPAGTPGPLACSVDAASEAPRTSSAPPDEPPPARIGEQRPETEGDAPPPLLPGILQAAARCSGHFESVALTLLQAQASPLAAIVSGMKAGYQLGRCMANEREAELQLHAERHAVHECQARGGTPDELSQGRLTCVMPAPKRPAP